MPQVKPEMWKVGARQEPVAIRPEEWKQQQRELHEIAGLVAAGSIRLREMFRGRVSDTTIAFHGMAQELGGLSDSLSRVSGVLDTVDRRMRSSNPPVS